MLTTLVGVLTFGFLSGILIVIAWAAIRRAGRGGDSTAIRLSWVALAFAVLGAAFSYWSRQYLLWEMPTTRGEEDQSLRRPRSPLRPCRLWPLA